VRARKGRGLLALPFASARPVHHAARQLWPLGHCGHRRSSLGDGKRTLTKATKEPSNPFEDFSPSSATTWLRRLCSSAPMCEPYLKAIREICSEALHILDRFHTVAK